MNYRTLTALVLSVASLSLQAETRWFEVELLVFERNANLQEMKELLSSEQASVNTQNSISILKAGKSNTCNEQVCLSEQNPTVISGSTFDSQGNNFRYLGSSGLQLSAQRKRLAGHANFKPVLHMAWRMPVYGPQQSKPLHLFAGENFAFKYPSQGLEANADKWAIDGNFKIYLNHFLYVDSQLVIRKEMTQEIIQPQQTVEVINDENGVQIASPNLPLNDTPPAVIKQKVLKEILFDQNRRLRSEEIHYLDHPLMGIIVQIRKIP